MSRDLSSGLRDVATAPTDSFSELVRRSGLNPATDFRNANLAGTDLRREDLRAFDFSRANFADAKVYGTRFNRTVRRHQLRQANFRIRAVVLPFGHHLEEIAASITGTLDNDFDVPADAADAIQRTGKLRERVYEGGAYLSDNSPLIRRHLLRDLRRTATSARNANLAVFLAQPQGDFDFDMLGVAQRAFRVTNTPVFSIIFTAALNGGHNAARLIQRRVQESGLRMADVLLVDDGGVISRRALSSEWKDGQTFRRVTEFLNIAATARRVSPANVKPNTRSGTETHTALISGRRAANETLAKAILRQLRDSEVPIEWDPPRFHLLIAKDRYELAQAQEAYEILGRRNLCDVSVYPASRLTSDFHVAVAPPQSTLWSLFGSAGGERPLRGR